MNINTVVGECVFNNAILNFMEASLPEHPLPWRAVGHDVIASDGKKIVECGTFEEAQEAVLCAEYLCGKREEADVRRCYTHRYALAA